MAGSPAAGPPRPNPGIGNQMVLLLVFVLAIFILFDQDIRQALGHAVGVVLYPLVGFDGQYAVLSLFITGLLMSCTGIIVRHFFVDWVEQARSARITSAFQKEFREARMSNNTYKVKKLTEIQPQIMAQSLKSSQTQMKLTPVTMIVVIPIFAWLSNFVNFDLASMTVAVPWSFNVDLKGVNVLPNWILLYSLLTLPFSQAVSRGLKYFSFNKRLRDLKEKPPEKETEQEGAD